MSSSVLHIRLPSELATRLADEAQREMRSRSQLVAYLVAKGLASDEKKEAQ
jgi:metal-responsive CopG/Arc/MetJ family transcriptional regulator